MLVVGPRIVAAAAVAPAISARSPAETAAVAERFAEQVLAVADWPVPVAEQAPVVEPLVLVGTVVRGPASSQCLPVPAAVVVVVVD